MTAPRLSVTRYAVKDATGQQVGDDFHTFELARNQATWLIESGAGKHVVVANAYQLASTTTVWTAPD